MLRPLFAFLRSAAAQKSSNLRGLPLIPKRIWPSVPHYRTGYNEFVLWIDRLALGNVALVIDVGANHGDFAQAASALFPTAHVILVEPLPLLHRELEARVAERNGRWTLVKSALGRAPGKSVLHIDPLRDDIASLAGFGEAYLQANTTARPGSAIECDVQTLDELCERYAIEKIDLLKVDVEGFEFEVLEGAKKMLAHTEAVIVELSLIRKSSGNDALEEMLRVLRSAGFSLVSLLPSYYDPVHQWRPLEFNLLARRLDSNSGRPSATSSEANPQ